MFGDFFSTLDLDYLFNIIPYLIVGVFLGVLLVKFLKYYDDLLDKENLFIKIIVFIIIALLYFAFFPFFIEIRVNKWIYILLITINIVLFLYFKVKHVANDRSHYWVMGEDNENRYIKPSVVMSKYKKMATICIIVLIASIGFVIVGSNFQSVRNILDRQLISNEKQKEQFINEDKKNYMYYDYISPVQYLTFREITRAQDEKEDKDLSNYIKQIDELDGYYLDENGDAILNFDEIFNYYGYENEDDKNYWDFAENWDIIGYKGDFYASDSVKMLNYYFNIENADKIIINNETYSLKEMKFGIRDDIANIDGYEFKNIVTPIESYARKSFVSNNKTVEFVLKCPKEVDRTGLVYILYLNNID